MTDQQTDIEKTLKRILARELKEWPEGEEQVMRPLIGFTQITRADWEAERALLALEQAQPLGDSEEFDQALWDKVASDACKSMISAYPCQAIDSQDGGIPIDADSVVADAFDFADAFMAERANRIAARKASHD